jgi:hypothetical protein
MTNKNESRDDCIAAIKECIKDDLQKPEIIKKMIDDYPGIHKSTYDVAQDELSDEDFVSGACIIETERQIKIQLKKRLMADLKKDYDTETDPTLKRNLRNDLLKHLRQF